jgi:hypothetical protein
MATGRFWSAIAFGLLVGCGSAEDTGTDDTTPTGACGAVTTHDVNISGVVHDGGGAGADGAVVSLEERSWDPGTLGTATAASDGTFTISATITGVEDCWGTALDYWLVASGDAGTAEDAVNQPLFNAVDDGSLTADVSGFPLVLE